ncbi:hypothetical protein [Oscillibacter valericigenes]|uniref:hypothetical protein n=1 Tax=Oscillibacter valericigenes TaxID=351091 RepID=UPI00195ED5D2|nr:hypothetical protein [Oscillibacter valericigenes]MBM6909278.1 hypothetical protein [Oscillibacter valericigenes]HJB76124.1 hypothetical protein [Candidatus Oscillibacter avistercoris]
MYSMAVSPSVERRLPKKAFFSSYHIRAPAAPAKATKKRPPALHRGDAAAGPRESGGPPGGALYVPGAGVRITVGDEQLLRFLLCVDQFGLQPAQGFLRVGDGVEEQQVFFGNLLHMVFILSKPPQDMEVAFIIHKGGKKFCLNLSRHPEFCKNFKNHMRFSEKRKKTRLF